MKNAETHRMTSGQNRLAAARIGSMASRAGLVAVQVLPRLIAAAGEDFPGLGERGVEEPQCRVEGVFLDRLPEPGEGL